MFYVNKYKRDHKTATCCNVNNIPENILQQLAPNLLLYLVANPVNTNTNTTNRTPPSY